MKGFMGRVLDHTEVSRLWFELQMVRKGPEEYGEPRENKVEVLASTDF